MKWCDTNTIHISRSTIDEADALTTMCPHGLEMSTAVHPLGDTIPFPQSKHRKGDEKKKPYMIYGLASLTPCQTQVSILALGPRRFVY